MGDKDARIAQIQQAIRKLPAGSIGKKTVNGKVYHYLRWQEGGKRREKYIPAAELELLGNLVEERKALEAELRGLLGKGNGRLAGQGARRGEYRTNVLEGSALRAFAEGAAGLKKRACFHVLHGYLTGGRQDKVLVLYGLRRTGKTTLIRQALLELGPDEFARAAFIQATPRDTLGDVNADLKVLRDRGFTRLFIDEATLMEDFIEGAALFSDVFAAGGMKVVLSGTDSLGFLFAEDEQLYDRCLLLHTTFIPYREFEQVLGIKGVDEYIRYGGTMSMGGKRYNAESTFSSKRSADEYVDSAIARNIQHSLRYYQYGGHFRALQDLYDAGELTSAINRVVEDVNHRFAVETLTRAFKSHDLAASARNLRNDREAPGDVLDRVDVVEVTARLAAALEIREKDEQSVEITPVHVREIREYLDLLDITADVGVEDMANPGARHTRTVVAQPGLRYAQVEALIESLLEDRMFADLSFADRARVLERVRSEVMGRMLEDIVLLETKLAFPERRVFKLQFAVGEFDMVVADASAGSCTVFEVKHSDRRHPAQYRALVDEGKCASAEFRFGPIAARTVLYRGASGSCEEDGRVTYLNVEDYLKSL